MCEYVCALCGNKQNEGKKCSRCGSLFLNELEDIDDEDFGLLTELDFDDDDDIDYENINLEDFEDDSLFEKNSIKRKK